MFYRKQLALEFAPEGWQCISNVIGELLQNKMNPLNTGKADGWKGDSSYPLIATHKKIWPVLGFPT